MSWRVFAIVLTLAVAGPPLAAHVGGLVRSQTCGAAGCELPRCDLPRVEYASPGGAAREGSLELLHFWRPTCPVCIKTQTRVRALQAQGYKIRSINTLQNPRLAGRYQINATPTFITLEDGVVVHRVAAGLKTADIAALLRP